MNSKENMKKSLAALSKQKITQANKFEYEQVSTISWLSKEKLNTGNKKTKTKDTKVILWAGGWVSASTGFVFPDKRKKKCFVVALISMKSIKVNDFNDES